MESNREVETVHRSITVLTAFLLLTTGFVANGFAHCQMPCGIYDDGARIDRMLEDTETILKAMNSMAELAGKTDPQSMNQMTRWIITKEEHASDIITIVSEYFLTQKVAPVASGATGYDAYLRTLADHHAVMRAAMKAKQNADPSFAAALHEAIDTLAAHYNEKK